MRATGIIRRIDDLGRIVIPKEIRRSMNIQEGDPLEIYTDEKGLLLIPHIESETQIERLVENEDIPPLAKELLNIALKIIQEKNDQS